MSPKNTLRETPSQTAGPYVHIGCTPNFCGIRGVFKQDLGAVMFGADEAGERITVKGCIFDGNGDAVKDALIEVWQADASGAYSDAPNISGFGRCPANQETGEFEFKTLKPGSIAQTHAPHISVWIVARGINIGLQTRMYFEDEDNSNDPVLAQIATRERVETLIARKTGNSEYTFNIRLQGHDETVFFDI